MGNDKLRVQDVTWLFMGLSIITQLFYMPASSQYAQLLKHLGSSHYQQRSETRSSGNSNGANTWELNEFYSQPSPSLTMPQRGGEPSSGSPQESSHVQVSETQFLPLADHSPGGSMADNPFSISDWAAPPISMDTHVYEERPTPEPISQTLSDGKSMALAILRGKERTWQWIYVLKNMVSTSIGYRDHFYGVACCERLPYICGVDGLCVIEANDCEAFCQCAANPHADHCLTTIPRLKDTMKELQKKMVVQVAHDYSITIPTNVEHFLAMRQRPKVIADGKSMALSILDGTGSAWQWDYVVKTSSFSYGDTFYGVECCQRLPYICGVDGMCVIEPHECEAFCECAANPFAGHCRKTIPHLKRTVKELEKKAILQVAKEEEIPIFPKVKEILAREIYIPTTLPPTTTFSPVTTTTPTPISTTMRPMISWITTTPPITSLLSAQPTPYSILHSNRKFETVNTPVTTAIRSTSTLAIPIPWTTKRLKTMTRTQSPFELFISAQRFTIPYPAGISTTRPPSQSAPLNKSTVATAQVATATTFSSTPITPPSTIPLRSLTTGRSSTITHSNIKYSKFTQSPRPLNNLRKNTTSLSHLTSTLSNKSEVSVTLSTKIPFTKAFTNLPSSVKNNMSQIEFKSTSYISQQPSSSPSTIFKTATKTHQSLRNPTSIPLSASSQPSNSLQPNSYQTFLSLPTRKTSTALTTTFATSTQSLLKVIPTNTINKLHESKETASKSSVIPTSTSSTRETNITKTPTSAKIPGRNEPVYPSTTTKNKPATESSAGLPPPLMTSATSTPHLSSPYHSQETTNPFSPIKSRSTSSAMYLLARSQPATDSVAASSTDSVSLSSSSPSTTMSQKRGTTRLNMSQSTHPSVHSAISSTDSTVISSPTRPTISLPSPRPSPSPYVSHRPNVQHLINLLHSQSTASTVDFSSQLPVTNTTNRDQQESVNVTTTANAAKSCDGCEESGGVCVMGSDFSAHCIKTLMGDACEQFQCVHGSCISTNGYYSCECFEGWTGTFCDKECQLQCGANGFCSQVDEGQSVVCVCHWNYTGEECDQVKPIIPHITEVAVPEDDFKLWEVAIIAIITAVLLASSCILLPYCLWRRQWLPMRKLIFYLKEYEDDDGKEYDAFISYKSCPRDERFVLKQLYPKLEKELDFRLCMHFRDFPPGHPIANNIIYAIENSRRTILILSPSYVKSEWCRMEYQKAQHEMLRLKHKIIPIVLEDIDGIPEMDKNLQTIIDTVTYIKWPGEVKVNLDRRIQNFWKLLELSMPKRRGECSQSFNSSDSSCSQLPFANSSRDRFTSTVNSLTHLDESSNSTSSLYPKSSAFQCNDIQLTVDPKEKPKPLMYKNLPLSGRVGQGVHPTTADIGHNIPWHSQNNRKMSFSGDSAYQGSEDSGKSYCNPWSCENSNNSGKSYCNPWSCENSNNSGKTFPIKYPLSHCQQPASSNFGRIDSLREAKRSDNDDFLCMDRIMNNTRVTCETTFIHNDDCTVQIKKEVMDCRPCS